MRRRRATYVHNETIGEDIPSRFARLTSRDLEKRISVEKKKKKKKKGNLRTGRWLVEEENRWRQNQFHSDIRSFSFATRDASNEFRADFFIGAFLQTQLRDHLPNDFLFPVDRRVFR